MNWDIEVAVPPVNYDFDITLESEVHDFEIEFNQTIQNVIGDDNSMLSIVASENILAFQPVTSNGEVANSNNLFHRNRVVGLAKENINNSFSGRVQSEGTITNPAWSWNKVPIYINGDGILSETPPSSGWSQTIGIAYKPDTITIEIDVAYLL